MANQPTVVLIAGSIAAGKSTAIRNSEYADWPIVDPDEFKKMHPEYDPMNPHPVHAWSQLQAGRLRGEYISGRISHVQDGTGSDLEKYRRRITEAKAAGFRVIILWVQCTLENALIRDKSKTRGREVGETMIRHKYPKILETMAAVADEVDAFTEIDTN
jgi:predicted ABC-type ATPase